MPKALTTKAGALLDSWGRSNNRKLLDKTLARCLIDAAADIEAEQEGGAA